MVSDGVLMGLQEAEYGIYATPDGGLDVRLIAWPKAPYRRDHLRMMRIGLVEVPLRVAAGGARHRIPVARQKEIIATARRMADLPGLSVCGSNSPLASRPPYRHSDLDLVCFVPMHDVAADPEHWDRWLSAVKRDVAPQLGRELGQEVSIGLLAEEQRCLPAMADAVAADDLVDIPERHTRADIVGGRISAFLDLADNVRRDLWRLVECLGLAQPVDPAEPLMYVGPRWFDVTFFFMNADRTSDLPRHRPVVTPASWEEGSTR